MNNVEVMKKNYVNLCICIAMLLGGLYSCKRSDDLLFETNVVAGFDIKSVKATYESQMATASGLRKEGKSVKTNKRKLRWDEAYTVATEDGNKLIVPLSLEEEIFIKDVSDSLTSYGTLTFFIVSKHKGKYEFETATYIPDYPEDPDKITPKWSGQIIVESIMGEFIKTFLVSNGEFKEGGIKNSRTATQVCVYRDWFQCFSAPDIGYYPPCTYLYFDVYCFDDGMYGGGGGGGGGSGGSGGSYAIIGGISPTSPTYSTIDRLTNLLRFSNMTSSQKASVNEVLEELVLYTCIGKALYVQIAAAASPGGTSKFNWYVDASINTPASYNPSTRTFKFKSQEDINLYNLSEELFHAYQNTHYSGGTAQYLTTGRPNIEFEAKVFRDLMASDKTMVNPWSIGTVQNVEYENYLSWIRTLTNDGNRYPHSYSEMSNQYYHYMNEFVRSYPEYNDPVIPDMDPTALFTLINSSNCPN
jgi:hypothetical protein